MTTQREGNIVHARGNVTVTTDDSIITADEADLHTDTNEIELDDPFRQPISHFLVETVNQGRSSHNEGMP